MAQAAASLLDWVWTHAVATDWPRRERLLQADIVARTGQLASQGWAAVLRDLGQNREWAGNGQLRINRYEPAHPGAPVRRAALLHPGHVVFRLGRLDEPARYAIYYPVAGRLAPADGQRHGGLNRLLGTNRATLLRLLGQPAGTTHLAARSGLPIGVGRQPPARPARRRRGRPPPVRTARAVLAHRTRRRAHRRRRPLTRANRPRVIGGGQAAHNRAISAGRSARTT